jgi:hypothetical protein
MFVSYVSKSTSAVIRTENLDLNLLSKLGGIKKKELFGLCESGVTVELYVKKLQ